MVAQVMDVRRWTVSRATEHGFVSVLISATTAETVPYFRGCAPGAGVYVSSGMVHVDVVTEERTHPNRLAQARDRRLYQAARARYEAIHRTVRR